MASKRQATPRHYRIRHCDGNNAAWMWVAVDNGVESNAFCSYGTAMSLDALLRDAHFPDGTVVELLVSTVATNG